MLLANMSSPFKIPTTPSGKMKIFNLHEKGMSDTAIAIHVGQTESVVHNIINRMTTTPESSPRAGRPRVTTKRDDRVIIRTRKVDRTKTAAKITRELDENTGLHVSTRTISRRLFDAGLGSRSRTPSLTPPIRRKDRKAHRRYATEDIMWTSEESAPDHSGNESDFSSQFEAGLGISSGRTSIRRKNRKARHQYAATKDIFRASEDSAPDHSGDESDFSSHFDAGSESGRGSSNGRAELRCEKRKVCPQYPGAEDVHWAPGESALDHSSDESDFSLLKSDSSKTVKHLVSVELNPECLKSNSMSGGRRVMVVGVVSAVAVATWFVYFALPYPPLPLP